MKHSNKIIDTFRIVKPIKSLTFQVKSNKNIEILDNNENTIDSSKERNQTKLSYGLSLDNDDRIKVTGLKKIGEISIKSDEIKIGKKHHTRNRNRSQGSYKKTHKQRSNFKTHLQNVLPIVRRSGRCSQSVMKNMAEQAVINSIVNNREDGLKIIQTEDKGRGVEGTISFEKDCFIVEYAGQFMNVKQAREKEAYHQNDSSKGSYMFYFQFKDSKYCIDATEETGRLGRLINHSKLNPNCYVKVIPIGDIPRLAIFAKRKIEIGDELLFDYGDRDKETIKANPWLGL